MASSPRSDASVFSVRIVSLDYYMSPPIPNLDFSYSSFLGTNVEEVPVIRIYGSTPAGQKACLHIHRALPYLYIPCVDNAFRSPEEGHKFIHILSNALEKALKHKGSSNTRRKHVHECCIVQAKKLYGYHASDDLFVKISLYYPHEVGRVAMMLLDGAILNTKFQPHESHIPYLLQFLVDYNLYGMSHLHLSKFKFRRPVPDSYTPRLHCIQRHGMQAHENSAIWLSSTVPSDFFWPDSTIGNELEDNIRHHIRRQSTCALEVDGIVNDILNEKYKMYTSLSQTRSDVKMVQSLVPIWEEEYERSGTPDVVRYPYSGRPTPNNVLGCFKSGMEYEKAVTELFLGIDETSPSKVHVVEGDRKLEECPNSCNPSGEPLDCPGKEDKTLPLSCRSLFQENKNPAVYEKMCQFQSLKSTSCDAPSEACRKAERESLDTEALGLLGWLTSSQAAEDFSVDDVLVHEAILSPLLSAKSYKEALDIAHKDYESASQQECQDILDSLEGVSEFERSKEQVSCSTDHDLTFSFSSCNAIPQVDGSCDDDFSTPRRDHLSEANMTSRRDDYSVHQVRRCSSTKSGGKHRRSKLPWGTLPFALKQEQPENSETTLFLSRHDEEMRSDSESSFSSGSKGDRPCGAGLDNYDQKEGKLAPLSSVRDLMRRKRSIRPDQLDTVVHNIEMMEPCLEEPVHHKSEGERDNVIPQESPPDIKSDSMDQDDMVQENMACPIACTPQACTIDRFLHIDSYSPANQSSLVSLSSDRVIQSNALLHKHLYFQKESAEGGTLEATPGSQNIALTDLSMPEGESIKISEPNQSPWTATESNISRGHNRWIPDASQRSLSCPIKLSASSKEFTTLLVESSNVNEGLGVRSSEEQPIGEPYMEKEDICARTVDAELALRHDISEYRSNQDDEIAQGRCLQSHFNGSAELSSALDIDVGSSKNGFHGDWKCNTLNDCKTCIRSDKIKDTLECVEMTFSRKPPSRDEVGKCPEDSAGDTWHDENSTDINNRQHANDILPFFSWKFGDGNSSNLLDDESLIFHQQNALGIPSHFQNDGSVLYLLTHASSPPSLESVQQWCTEVDQRNCLNVLSGSSGTHCHPSRANFKVAVTENQDSQIDIVSSEQQETCLHFKQNAVKSYSHDLSQISGPDIDGKSGLTPLSQIGFRDTASTGAGQQLTLISMEVQAESSGDLLPDPKVDAVNVLCVAIQEDSSHAVEVHVLMRCKNDELCWRNVDGVSDCKFSIFSEEKHLLDHFMKMISSFDPDILMGWEIQSGSLGFLAERASHLGISLLKKISRTAACEIKCKASDLADLEQNNMQIPVLVPDTVPEYSIIEDEWGRTHASGIHVSGRIVLNIWRLMRAELKLHMYSIEAVAEEVLRRKIPSISNRVLNQWFLSGPGQARHRCISYVIQRVKLNLEIMNTLDMINRTSELARVFGIDFFSVLSRGSQFRVESMLLRLAHTQNYLAISPGSQQVASQPAMECLPLVMEPESGFYADPVVVLDFQSLYPSMIIAYNLCYSTCLGTVASSNVNTLGVTSYFRDPQILKDFKQQLLLTPNGILYVPSMVRRGVLPRLLEEILSTRLMVKQALKKLMPSQHVLQRVFNARQLALKLISNVTYGYTAAGFSGRMPCAELADSIVQCGRRTLETAISFVNQHDKWRARVIYGDTDSMFVLLKGRSREEAFRIGSEIASAITSMNPDPVTLKMEKVYHPCFLLTKKRYVGYSYEIPDQENPTFDAKGIETVRRDTCAAVAKTLERSIRMMFEHQDISIVKTYLQRQWRRILSGKVSLQDFIFAKEVRLGTYSARASSLPPAAIVATKAMRSDPRAEPRYGERIPYVVIHGEPGARLVDMVVSPYILLDIRSPYRLNELYYIKKQIIPALQRVFGLLGADINQWFSELPRPVRPTLAKRHSYVSHTESLNEVDSDNRSENSKMVKRSRIDTYYSSKHCTLCGKLVQASAYLCGKCSKKESLVVTVMVGETSKLERDIQHLAAICRHCGGGDWIIESGVKCTSLACSVFYERRKVQKELQTTASFATAAGFHPRCMAEWF